MTYDLVKITFMMNEFITALCSNARNERIPEEYDFFGGLIGEWDIVWNDHLEDAEPRKVKGEWIFSRVLDGTAVQDLFLVPSREERLINKYCCPIKVFVWVKNKADLI